MKLRRAHFDEGELCGDEESVERNAEKGDKKTEHQRKLAGWGDVGQAKVGSGLLFVIVTDVVKDLWRLRAVALVASLAGCGEKTPEERNVVVYVPKGCPFSALGLAVFRAFGDFEPPLPLAPLPIGEGGLLSISPDAEEVSVDIAEGGARWLGLGRRRESSELPLLALPHRMPCGLTQTLGVRPSAHLGLALNDRALVVGGGAVLDGLSRDVLVVNLSRGFMEPAEGKLLRPRAAMSVTPFGHGALIAGGRRPDTGDLLDTAEVYDATGEGPGRLQPTLVPLSRQRAEHGAAVLSSGASVLVGGIGADGKVLASIEEVVPEEREGRTVPAMLRVARRDPTVLVTRFGKVVVLGGLSQTGMRIREVEWFSETLGEGPLFVSDLGGPGKEQGFVALPSGAVLAVVVRESNSENAVLLLRPDGQVDLLAPIPGDPLARVVLLPGRGGHALLFTGREWLEFDPLRQAFAPIAFAGGASEFSLGPQEGELFVSPDPGLVLWLTESPAGSRLVGLRHFVESAFASPSEPLFLREPDTVSFDRPVGKDVTFSVGEGLSLAEGAHASLFDATFGAFDAEIVLAKPGELPLVLLSLGEEVLVSDRCRVGAVTLSPVHVKRDGGGLTVSSERGTSQCHVPSGRVSLALRGMTGGSFVRSVRIQRR